MLRASTSEMLIELHMTLSHEEAKVSQLTSQVDALQATVRAFTKDNAYLRELNAKLEEELQQRWTQAEVLSSMGARIEAIVNETNEALKRPSYDRNIHGAEHQNRLQDSEVRRTPERTQPAPNDF